MRLELLTPEDPRWADFLEAVPHDFYHLPGYTRLTARQEEARAEAVLATDGADFFFVPYLIRSILSAGGRYSDVCSPYGYPCPLFRGAEAGFLQNAIGRWIATMRERDIVSGFVRMHPLLPVLEEDLGKFGTVTLRGRTVSIDLSLDDDFIWSQFRRSHQVNIKQTGRKGVTATFAQDAPARAEFASIYQETMNRVGAVEYYHFPPWYFEELASAVGDRMWIATARAATGEGLSSALLIECRGIVQYHLGGTRTAALWLTPNKFLFDCVWRWAKARGQHVIHLGGGLGSAEDSLFHFKAGFSNRRHSYRTWQAIFLKDIYEKLTAERQRAGVTPREGFFPAYRG